ncbi:MAG: alpha/beta fold hydrolase [Burkholderiaceae bacterium]
MSTSPSYLPRRASDSLYVQARGLRHHVRAWGRNDAPRLWMVHGWMDVSASWQFVVDCLARDWRVLAPDWRGFGLTDRAPADCYWFPDYLADFEAVLDELDPGSAINLVAHSMGGTVAMTYAGVRPQRIRRLVSLEGFGLNATRPADAPGRLAQWLDDIRDGSRLKDYANLDEVADRLRQTNPRLTPDRAAWLASHWAAPDERGRLVLLGDPSHKATNPYLYRVDEANACWSAITAPVLLVGADRGTRWEKLRNDPAYRDRLACIASIDEVTLSDAGHMLHHDQPEQVAALIERFMGD